jgi:broad specificity phosphatase PhoE
MRVILVGHGETQSAPTLLDGRAPLSELGQRQAQALAAELRDTIARRQSIEKVYSGRTTPALATATLIAGELDLGEPDALAGLMHEAEALSAVEASDDAVVELLRGVADVAWSTIEQFRETHADEAQVVGVAHPLTVRAIVCRALALPLESHRRFRVDPGSLTIIAFRQQRTILASLNETCHLGGLPRP